VLAVDGNETWASDPEWLKALPAISGAWVLSIISRFLKNNGISTAIFTLMFHHPLALKKESRQPSG